MSILSDMKKGKRLRLIIDTTDLFPEKVYDIANDGHLIQWNGTGTAITVSDIEFEANVMTMYPGFLQIASFLNLRRLFRQYGFDWKFIGHLPSGENQFEFSHPSFLYGQRDRLCEVVTRRKSFSRPSRKISKFHEDVLDIKDDEDYGRHNTRQTRAKRGRYRTKRGASNCCRPVDMSIGSETSTPNFYSDGDSFSDFSFREELGLTNDQNDNSFALDDFEEQTLVQCVNNGQEYISDLLSNTNTNMREIPDKNKSKFRHDIMNMFFKNEFSFEEFCLWMERNAPTIDSSGQRASKVSDGHPCMKCPCCAHFSSTCAIDENDNGDEKDETLVQYIKVEEGGLTRKYKLSSLNYDDKE